MLNMIFLQRGTTANHPLLSLHCFLLICLKAILAVSVPLNDTTIREAVTAWTSNPNTAKAVYGPIETWNTSLVTNMYTLFSFKQTFNEDLSGWDTSRVTDMNAMFYGAYAFNGNVSTWNTSNVVDMSGMFDYAKAFNRSVAKWDTSRVTDMSWMFALADSYRADEKLAWNTSKVTNMYAAFYKAPSFNGDISSWDTSKVTRMDAMFNDASSFNGNLSAWNTKKVTDFSLMFSGATSFNGNISLWDTSMVSTMYAMFYLAPSFNGDISLWNTMRVANMTALFYRATTFNGVLSYWNTSSVRETRVMFLDAVSFNRDLISWNTSRVTNMNSMFYNATSFNGNIRSWDTSRVLDMSQMFAGAKVFNQTLCWNTSIALKVNVFSDSRGSFSSLTFPSCLTSAPTAKPSIRTTYRSTHKPTIWPKPWLSDTSILYGSTISNPTFNHSTCPEGSKVVSIWGRSANWIIQLSATCDDKGHTVLGPWGQSQGTSGVVPPCADGYNGWNITYGSFIGRISFACASSSFVMGPALGSGFAFGAGSTNRTLLSRNQSLIGFQVYYDSLGIRAMKFEYAELPSKGRCLNSIGDPTGRCPSKADWLALLWGFLTLSGVFGICGFIFVRVRRRRHKMKFKGHDTILPLK